MSKVDASYLGVRTDMPPANMISYSAIVWVEVRLSRGDCDSTKLYTLSHIDKMGICLCLCMSQRAWILKYIQSNTAKVSVRFRIQGPMVVGISMSCGGRCGVRC